MHAPGTKAFDHEVRGAFSISVSSKARADVVQGIVNIKNDSGYLSTGVTGTISGGDGALRLGVARHGSSSNSSPTIVTSPSIILHVELKCLSLLLLA